MADIWACYYIYKNNECWDKARSSSQEELVQCYFLASISVRVRSIVCKTGEDTNLCGFRKVVIIRWATGGWDVSRVSCAFGGDGERRRFSYPFFTGEFEDFSWNDLQSASSLKALFNASRKGSWWL